MKWIFALLCTFIMSSAFAQKDLYEVKETSIDGKAFDMNTLKGKVVMFVNIASQCGYTPQLKSLETVYRQYKAQGFVMVGVPANNFGEQMPGTDKEIQEFCSKNYDVTFPILKKQNIVTDNIRPLYAYIYKNLPSAKKGDVRWNFEKVLVSKKGVIVDRFSSSVEPFDKVITTQIDKLLKDK